MLSKLDFLKQLTTIKATGGTVETEAKALLRFGEMFAGSLWDVFVRESRVGVA